MSVNLFFQTSTIVGFFPLSFALVSRTVEPDSRESAISAGMFFGDISLALMPLLLRIVADHYSFSSSIPSIGLLMMLSPLLLWTFRQEK
jgi:fucose permease